MIPKPLSRSTAIPAIASRHISSYLRNRSRLAALGTILIALLFGAGSTASAQAVMENFGTVNIGTTSSVVPLVFTFGTSDTLSSVAVLTQGATGLDFADAGSDTCVAGTAYSSGQTCTVNVTFTPRFAGNRNGAVVLEDTSGNAIAIGSLQGTGVGPQIAFLPGTQIAYSADGSGPVGVTVDGYGDIYFCPAGSGAVFEFAAVNGVVPPSPTLKKVASGFGSTVWMAMDAGGNLFLADTTNNAVEEVLAVNGVIPTSPTIRTLGSGFSNPGGIAVDGTGNVYVTGFLDGTVKEILAVNGTIPKSPTIKILSTLSHPTSIAVDSSGNIFVSDEGTYLVQEILAVNGSIPASPTIKTLGSGFNLPYGLTVDANENVYVADYGNNAVKEIFAASGYTTVKALGSGFTNPGAIVMVGSGNIYVGDYGNDRIVKLDLADPPSLTFANTSVGTPSSDSPRTVTIENIGNAGLIFPVPPTGNNPSISTNFILNSSSSADCTLLTTESSGPATLAPGASCQLPISFVPTATGTLTGSLVLIDSNLNAEGPSYVSQAITLNGTVSGTFTLGTSPSSVTLAPGSSVTSTITVTAQNGFTGSVSLSASSLPSGVTATFSPNPASGTSLLTLTANSAAAGGSFAVTISGSSGTVTASTRLILIVPTINFIIQSNPLTVNEGGSVTTSILVGDLGGPTGSVTLTASGLPSGVAASFSPNPTSNDTVLTITASSSAVTSSGRLLITGTDGAVTGSFYLGLVINPPATFSLGVTSDGLTLNQGASGTFPITINPRFGFSGNVNLSVSSLPSGVTASFSPNPTTGSSVLTLTVGNTTATGTYPLTVNGTSGTIAASVGLNLTVTQPFFTLQASPSILTMAPGATVTTTIPISGRNGFAGSVNLLASNLPNGVTASFNPASTTGTSVLTLSASSSASPGFYNVYVSGTSGALSARNTIYLTIPGFTPSVANLGALNIGTTGQVQTLTYTFGSTVTLSSITVLTQGAAGLDFTDAGTGSCTQNIEVGNTQFVTAESCTVNVAFTPGFAGARYGAVVLNDNNGNVVATAYLQGIGVGPQLNFLPGVQSVLGSGFNFPAGVTVDNSGDLFIADFNNSAVKEILAVNGSIPASPIIRTLGSGFLNPASLAIDGGGNLYVTDYYKNQVYVIPQVGGYSTVNAIGGGFSNVWGVAVDGNGNVFVADTGNSAVKEIPAGCVASTCVTTLGSGFSNPLGVAVDANANVFVADNGNGAVKEILAATGYTTVSTLATGLSAINGLALDGNGNVYVANTGNQNVLELPASNGYSTVNTLVGSFGNPYGVVVDEAGNVFVADAVSAGITKLDLSDPPSLTFASTAVGSTSADSPQTVTVENVGNAVLNFSEVSYPASFPERSSETNDCTASTTLSANQACTLTIDFSPSAAGALSGSIVLTDNNLNTPTPGSVQSISLIGTATQATPTITWAAPVAITYGTPLSGTQLNATSTVAGTFTYSPATGTVLTVGTQTLTATFTPTDSTDYTTATATVTLTVSQATPSIVWTTPTPIAYGTVLSATQLNASSTVAGTFTYSPAAGTILSAGTQTLTATFTPTDTTDYTTSSASVTITVNKATSTINWAAPAAITYGTALSATQLNATSTVAGTFTYTPAIGTVLTAGTQTLNATFTPTDTTDYTSSSASVTITVKKATPTITWAAPAAITYGTPLTASQLNAASTTAGTFTYSPAAGTILNAGAQTLTVTFTPTDATDYATASGSVPLTVNKAGLIVTWPTPAAISYGTALSATQLDATSNAAGTYSYSPAAGTVLAPGNHTLSVTFTASTPANYTTATKSGSVTLTVNKATPTITWATPTAVSYGTKLSGTQLDASASVSGTFAYSPASGTVLPVGNNMLKVTFTPSNTTDYTTATASVTLTVNKATPVITWAKPNAITYGTALSATQLNATSTIAGTFKYSPASGTVLSAGSQTLSVTFTPTNTTDYATATASVTLTVNKATPAITWATPRAITHGTPLSATQLNATSKVAGRFTYSPATGTVLAVGNQKLTATFTPTDTANYTTATASVTLTVNR